MNEDSKRSNLLRFNTSCIFQEAYRGINYLILQNRRQKRWRTIKVDHVLNFFSFYFFIPLSQQYYCGIASHFGKSPYFDVKFSYLDDFFLKFWSSVEVGEAAGRGRGTCLVVPGLAGTVARALSSSSRKASSYCDEKALGTVSLTFAKNSKTFILLVSAWARGPHRNS